MTDMLTELRTHLESRYRRTVDRLTPLEPWAPEGVQRVDRHDGPPWVARVFGPDHPTECVQGDAEILRFLEEHSFPAERCIDDAVSTFGDWSLLLTHYIDAPNLRTDNSPATLNAIGELNGRLHALPTGPGAVSRAAGGWHQLSQAGGGKQADIEALLPAMDERAKSLHADDRDTYERIRKHVETMDDAEDLPKALINVDFGGPNVLRAPDGLVVVDWTNSGRGPRVLGMNPMLAGSRDLALVDAYVAGYRKHVQLTDAELDRLPTALAGFSIVLDAWFFVFRGAPPAKALAGIEGTYQDCKLVADRAREAFAER